MQGAAPELRHSIIRAGAGAGKTTGLVARVIEVYKLYRTQGLRPRIVVTTFTRKATQELKERLIKSACKAEDADLLQFVTDPARLQISTIHGLLNVFLRQVGHLAGLDAGFQIVSEVEGAQMARLALRETLLAEPDGLKWLETYGFRRVLTMLRAYEMAWRERGHLEPADLDDIETAVAQVAESWKAELKEFAASVLEEVDEPKWVEFAENLGAFLSSWSGSGADLERLPSKPRRSKSQEHLEAWHERAELLNDFKKEMKRECFDHRFWPAMTECWRAFAPFAERFREVSARMKDAQARFEMSDLELKSIEILRAKPFLGAIFADNWDYWMIDEYQDTSPLQVACLRALIGDRPAYYVGDPQQSIYLFRGAEVRVFEDAQNEIESRNGERRELRRNYRSEPDLLMWINDFMASVGPAFQPMEPRQAATGSTRTSVTLLRATDAERELEAVVARVGELLDEGAGLEQICILGRTHRTLMDVSRALRERGYPTHVHSARGFAQRREVLDAQALWKFLVHPHDNRSLMILLRSPWFYVPDGQLAEWMENKPTSLWRKLAESGDNVPESIQRLRGARARLGRLGIARTFEETLCAAAMIDLSLVNDPAGRKESNLWKLILRAREIEKEGGQSLLDFVDSGAGGDALEASEGDATSAQEPNSINLMTIHGAKGLEFEHVIIPRMGESPTPSVTAPLASHEDKFFFPSWNDDMGEFVSSPLDYLKMRAEVRRELEEFDRWLYVALTRAKSTLTLTLSEIRRHSWASRSDWFQKPAGLHKGSNYQVEVREDDFVAKPYTGPRRERTHVRTPWRWREGEQMERHSVTTLVTFKGRTVPREDLLRRWQAQNEGTRIHRALEALRYGGASVHSEDKAVRFVLDLNKPPMRELIQNGEAEWGFQVQTPTGVIEGQIDLWSKLEGRLYVVDYKSGSQAFKEAAFTQLSLYAWALRKFGHVEPAELVVIYPLAGKVESREFSPDLFTAWEVKFSGAET